MHIR